MFADERWLARSWNPWRELSRLQNEVNSLFAGAPEGRSPATPAMNVWTSDDGAVLRATLPGFTAEDIDISVLGDSVTVSGKRVAPADDKELTYHRREREFGTFTRTLQLPFRLEPDEVKAEFKNGILELTLPRANSDRPKRISVKTN